MVAVVGTGHRRGAGTLAGVEAARSGPALEVSVESVPSTVVPQVEPWMAPRAEPRTTPPNVMMEERGLHVDVP